MRDQMPCFRLVVRRDGDWMSQGTGWFVTKSKVVTAWHVIDKLHLLPGVSFELEIEGGPIRLEYVVGQAQPDADVAVLNVRAADLQRVRADMVLALADGAAPRHSEWFAKGFPKRREGKEQTADGSVTDPLSDGRLQLFLRQGTDETWEGMSGAPVMIGDKVNGVITVESGYRDNTAWAVPYTVVERLVPELRGRTWKQRYRDWFVDEYRPPEWCRAFSPRVTVESSVLDLGQLVALITARSASSDVWIIAGDNASERNAVLRRIADLIVRLDPTNDAGGYQMPLWCTPPNQCNMGFLPFDTLLTALKACQIGAVNSVADAIVDDVKDWARRGSVFFILDDAGVAQIADLRQTLGGDCVLLLGLDRGSARQIPGAQICELADLSEFDRKTLASYWRVPELQVAEATGMAGEFLPIALRPLDVSVWCRATTFDKGGTVIRADPKELPTIVGLGALTDSLIKGLAVPDYPLAAGVSSTQEPTVRRVLAGVAYLSLVEGTLDLESETVARSMRATRLRLPETSVVARSLAQVASQCGLVQEVAAGRYRFIHAVLRDYFAALAMPPSSVHLSITRDDLAEDACRTLTDERHSLSWSRALAFRLDRLADESVGDASQLLGDLLNYGLSRDYGRQLRNRSGPLSGCVCRAVLHSESLYGNRLRTALGWAESPGDWTGYRPDEWRGFEELLRYLDGVALRVQGDDLALLLGRLLRGAETIDVALIRFALAKDIKRRQLVHDRNEALERLYERERFFDLAGRPCSECDKTGILDHLATVPEGWFVMGTLESEERSWPNERPQHRVFLRQYWITSTEVTNEQYEFFDPSHKGCRFAENHPADLMGDWRRHPVIRVSWYEAWCFAEWIGLRLPTEAQWEKAARGESFKDRPPQLPDSPRPYWFEGGEDALLSVAWFKGNSDRHTWDVDRRPGDSFRLKHPFDLAGLGGNVWEWCQDEQGLSYPETGADRDNPDAFESVSEEVLTNRMIRGGSFDSPAWNCRHAVRHYTFPTVRAATIGFRLCMNSTSG